MNYLIKKIREFNLKLQRHTSKMGKHLEEVKKIESEEMSKLKYLKNIILNAFKR